MKIQIEVDLNDLLMERVAGENGPYPKMTAMAGHLTFMRDLVKEVNAQTIVELGVHSGQSTIAFLAGLAETGGKLWSCDAGSPQAPISMLLGRLDFWEFTKGDSRSLGRKCPDDIDILLLDTMATYDQKIAELQIYGPLVKPGGYILVHDTDDCEECVKACQDYVDQDVNTIIQQNRPGSHGMTVLRVLDAD